jgi:hypothetical protein
MFLAPTPSRLKTIPSREIDRAAVAIPDGRLNARQPSHSTLLGGPPYLVCNAATTVMESTIAPSFRRPGLRHN